MTKPLTAPLSELVSWAIGSIQDIGSELTDWADNMPENLQSSDKHDSVAEAGDLLANIEELEIPQAFEALAVTYFDAPRRASKQTRLQVAVDALGNCIEAAEAAWLEMEKADPEATAMGEEAQQEFSNFVDELQNLKDEAEGQEW